MKWTSVTMRNEIEKRRLIQNAVEQHLLDVSEFGRDKKIYSNQVQPAMEIVIFWIVSLNVQSIHPNYKTIYYFLSLLIVLKLVLHKLNKMIAFT